MNIQATKTSLEEILYLRHLFLQENNVQIRYNARHHRGWTDSYIISLEGVNIGYGSIAGYNHIGDRDTVFEFFIIPPYRHLASPAFLSVLQASGATIIECQTNDVLMPRLIEEYAHSIERTTVLLGEGFTSNLHAPGTTFRRRGEGDQLFKHKDEPEGDFILIAGDEIVASGGFLLHYNMPFADLYMEVKEEHRRKGYGSFLIQEVKRACYLAGRVPAARTGMTNIASKATLMKAGLSKVDYILMGRVK